MESINAQSINGVVNYLLDLQDRITETIEQSDGKATFTEDRWQRPAGGGGRSRVLVDGGVFEQAGINFSHVHGNHLPLAAVAQRPELVGRSFQAMGLSLVFHPQNPYIPTTHMNIRLFVSEKPNQPTIWWFGGGFDLTPYYPFEADIIHWHQTARAACQPFGKTVYAQYKKWCDEYFYIKHRHETRGVGGVFFDDLNQWGFTKSFAFLKSIGEHFTKAYMPIVERRKDHAYGPKQTDFQRYRRGRYVEFNLVYDRGTTFGLQTGGRTESILMSLPPCVHFRYNWHPSPDSEEARLYEYLTPRDWLASA